MLFLPSPACTALPAPRSCVPHPPPLLFPVSCLPPSAPCSLLRPRPPRGCPTPLLYPVSSLVRRTWIPGSGDWSCHGLPTRYSVGILVPCVPLRYVSPPGTSLRSLRTSADACVPLPPPAFLPSVRGVPWRTPSRRSANHRKPWTLPPPAISWGRQPGLAGIHPEWAGGRSTRVLVSQGPHLANELPRARGDTGVPGR
jgi:hypothetical protein